MTDKSLFMKLKEDEREVRKSLIMAAALELFKEKPFDEIGMRDIAAAAGVSAASIYRYFPSQEELFIEAFIQDLVTVGDTFKERMAYHMSQFDTVPSPQVLDVFAEDVIDHLLDNEATFQMMSFLMIKGEIPPHLLARFNSVQKSFLDKIDEVLHVAGFNEEIRLSSHAIFASVMGVLMTFRNYPGRRREDIRKHVHRLANLVANVFKFGLNPALSHIKDTK